MFKVLVFTSYFLLILPVGWAMARSKPIVRDFCFYAMVFMTSQSVWQINLFPLPEYTGTARGFAFTFSFFFGLILLSSMLFNKDVKFSLFPAGSFCYLIYFTFSCISLINSDLLLQSGFEVWKMIVMYIIMLATYNYLKTVRNLWPFTYTVIAVISYVFLIAMYQKYIRHDWHIASTFPHRNSMSLYCTIFGTYLMGIFLNEKRSTKQTFFMLWGIACASVLVLFSLSRGGLVAYGFGQVVTIAVSLALNGIDKRKIQIVLGLALLLSIPVLIVIPRIIHRFENAPETSGTTRVNLAKAAVRIANVNFWGIGLNNFSDKSSPRYDYSEELYGTMKEEEKAVRRGGIVETIYLLVAAECGWITLGALLFWFVYYYFMNIGNLLAYRFMPSFGVTAGFFGGLTSNYIQSCLEWSLKQENNFAQIMIVFAVIAVMKYFRRGKKKRFSAAA